MGKMTSKNWQTVMALLVVMLAIFSLACDKNMAPPDALVNPAISVAIGEFSASSVTVIAGESTTLSWSVNNPEDKIQFISIDPGVGNVPESGSKVVKPKKTTIYHLNIYMNNEIVKSQSVGITVTDDDGNEVTEDPVEPVIPTAETSCTDQLDEDVDGVTDCDDSDCATDNACIEPVYRFVDCEEPPHVVSNSSLVGDEIAIGWKGCPFDEVWVNGLAGYIFGGAEDTYTFTAEDAETVNVMLMGRVGNSTKDSVTLKIDVSAVVTPSFDAEVDFRIEPSVVYAGQKYKVIWSVNNASTVTMDTSNQANNLSGVEYTAEEDGRTHTLTVTDLNGITEAFNKTVEVSAFLPAGGGFRDNITQMVPGAADGEYYFVGESNKVYHATDYVTAVTEIATTGVASAITALALEGGTVFVGNKDGVFKSGADKFTQVSFTWQAQTVSALLGRGNGDLLAGTDHRAYSMHPTGALYNVTQLSNNAFPTGGTVQVRRFIRSITDPNYVVAITDKGVLESSDNGANFTQILEATDIKGGDWNHGGAYLWSDSRVYEWNGSSFVEVTALSGYSGINAVGKVKGTVFVATESGVVASQGGGNYFTTNLVVPVRYMIVGSSGVMVLTGSSSWYHIDAVMPTPDAGPGKKVRRPSGKSKTFKSKTSFKTRGR